MNICILLATYNGEKFLKKQLDSLIKQTKRDWICLIRDDGSQDTTIEIIKDYCSKDTRFSLVTDNKGSQGNAMANFSLLIEEGIRTEADFFFFSDQDDVWVNNKLELICAEFKSCDIDRPLLIHHDLEVVNQELSQLSPSFIDYSALEATPSFSRLLGRNTVTGCASACNRKLLELSIPLPKQALMHDWWLALVASYVGELHFVNKSLIKYRQHEDNVLGAQSYKRTTILKLFSSVKKGNLKERFKKTFDLTTIYFKSLRQAEAFLELVIVKEELSCLVNKRNMKALLAYCKLLKISRFHRAYLILYYGFLQNKWEFKIVEFLRLIIYSPKSND